MKITTPNFKALSTQPRIALWTLVVIATTVTLAFSSLGETMTKAHIKDDGIVQLTGLFTIALATIVALSQVWFDKVRRKSYLLLVYILSIYTFREGDLHYHVSEHAKVTQFKRFYLHPEISLLTKILTASVLLGFVFCVWRFFSMHREVFFNALQQGKDWALLICFWVVFFVLSQICDRNPMNDYYFFNILEEVLEAMAEFTVLLVLFTFMKANKILKR